MKFYNLANECSLYCKHLPFVLNIIDDPIQYDVLKTSVMGAINMLGLAILRSSLISAIMLAKILQVIRID